MVRSGSQKPGARSQNKEHPLFWLLASGSWLLGFDITMRRLTRADTRREEAAHELHQLHDWTGTHIYRGDNEKHNFRVEDHEADQHCRAKECEARAVFLCIEFLEAEITNAADHQE